MKRARPHSPTCSNPCSGPRGWARCSCDSAHARSIRWPTRGSSYGALASGSPTPSPIPPPTRTSRVPCPCTSSSWTSPRNSPSGCSSATRQPTARCRQIHVCPRVCSTNRPRLKSPRALDRWWSPCPSGRSRPERHSAEGEQISFKIFQTSFDRRASEAYDSKSLHYRYYVTGKLNVISLVTRLNLLIEYFWKNMLLGSRENEIFWRYAETWFCPMGMGKIRYPLKPRIKRNYETFIFIKTIIFNNFSGYKVFCLVCLIKNYVNYNFGVY